MVITDTYIRIQYSYGFYSIVMASVLDVQFLPPCELLRGEFKCNGFFGIEWNSGVCVETD